MCIRDSSYAAHILLNDVVELIVGVENALEHGVHLDDYQHEQDVYKRQFSGYRDRSF